VPHNLWHFFRKPCAKRQPQGPQRKTRIRTRMMGASDQGLKVTSGPAFPLPRSPDPRSLGRQTPVASVARPWVVHPTPTTNHPRSGERGYNSTTHAPTAHSAVLQQPPVGRHCVTQAGTGEIGVYEYVYEYGGTGSIAYSYTYSYTPIQFGRRLRCATRFPPPPFGTSSFAKATADKSA